MSDAQATVEQSVLMGLIEHPRQLQIGEGEQIVKDVMKWVFSPNVRWSVKEYLAELEQGDEWRGSHGGESKEQREAVEGSNCRAGSQMLDSG